MLYTNKHYTVTLSGDHTKYIVTNNDTGVEEHTCIVLPEAFNVAKILNDTLETIISPEQKSDELEDPMDIPKNSLN